MLTPRERFELANFQKASLLLLPDPRFNFGPIRCLRRPIATARTHADVRECIEVKPLKSEEPILHLDDAWPHTPPRFRRQFRLACGEPMECTDINAELSTMVDLMQRAANKLGTGDPLGDILDIALWMESTAMWSGFEVKEPFKEILF
jgi:hypothetical protein